MDILIVAIVLLLLFGGGGGLYWGMGMGWGIGPIGLIVLAIVISYVLFGLGKQEALTTEAKEAIEPATATIVEQPD